MRTTILWFALVTAGHATAGDGAPVGARSPGDMTGAERAQMMKTANAYNTCVYEEAIAGLDRSPDIRQVADLALGACQVHLEKLGAEIRGWGFEEGFATAFTRNVRNRAARRILPELAIRKSR